MTAEQFSNNFTFLEKHTWDVDFEKVYEFAREFAKFHVKAALEAASKKASVYHSDFDIATGGKGKTETYISESSILNAYPLENIK